MQVFPAAGGSSCRSAASPSCLSLSVSSVPSVVPTAFSRLKPRLDDRNREPSARTSATAHPPSNVNSTGLTPLPLCHRKRLTSLTCGKSPLSVSSVQSVVPTAYSRVKPRLDDLKVDPSALPSATVQPSSNVKSTGTEPVGPFNNSNPEIQECFRPLLCTQPQPRVVLTKLHLPDLHFRHELLVMPYPNHHSTIQPIIHGVGAAFRKECGACALCWRKGTPPGGEVLLNVGPVVPGHK